MIDCELLQDYICQFDNVVDCDITVGTITSSTESTCKCFAKIVIEYRTISAGNQTAESFMYAWSSEKAVSYCLNYIALKVSNLSIDTYLRGIAAGLFVSRIDCNG